MIGCEARGGGCHGGNDGSLHRKEVASFSTDQGTGCPRQSAASKGYIASKDSYRHGLNEGQYT